MTTTLRIEDYTHAPMARYILTTGEFGRCEGKDTYHQVADVPVSARQPEAEARKMAALFALAPRMAEALRDLLAYADAALAGEPADLDAVRTARAILRELERGT